MVRCTETKMYQLKYCTDRFFRLDHGIAHSVMFIGLLYTFHFVSIRFWVMHRALFRLLRNVGRMTPLIPANVAGMRPKRGK